MNKASKLFLAFIMAITISAGFAISHNYKELTDSVKAWYFCSGGEDTVFLDDGMKKAMLTARDELQDVDYSAKNSRKN